MELMPRRLASEVSPGADFTALKQLKEEATAKGAEGPQPPEAGTPGNKRLLGWLANRVVHGVMNPTQTAAKAVAAMTPGSESEGLEQAMNLAPVGGFTAVDVKRMLKSIEEEGVRKVSNLYRAGVKGDSILPALDDIVTGVTGREIEDALGRVHPDLYRGVRLSQEGSSSMAVKPTHFNDAPPGVLTFNPSQIVQGWHLYGYPGKKDMAAGILHELAHDAFTRGRGVGLDRLPIRLYDGGPGLYIKRGEVPGITRPDRFRETLQRLEGTDLGNILRTWTQGYLPDRASYWKLNLPKRLPYEEYFADAIGGRAANVPGFERMPVDWRAFEPLFK